MVLLLSSTAEALALQIELNGWVDNNSISHDVRNAEISNFVCILQKFLTQYSYL